MEERREERREKAQEEKHAVSCIEARNKRKIKAEEQGVLEENKRYKSKARVVRNA